MDEKHLAVVSDRVERLEHTIYGNGQPGKFKELENRIESNHADTCAKIEKLQGEMRKHWTLLIWLLSGIGGTSISLNLVKFLLGL